MNKYDEVPTIGSTLPFGRFGRHDLDGADETHNGDSVSNRSLWRSIRDPLRRKISKSGFVIMLLAVFGILTALALGGTMAAFASTQARAMDCGLWPMCDHGGGDPALIESLNLIPKAHAGERCTYDWWDRHCETTSGLLGLSIDNPPSNRPANDLMDGIAALTPMAILIPQAHAFDCGPDEGSLLCKYQEAVLEPSHIDDLEIITTAHAWDCWDEEDPLCVRRETSSQDNSPVIEEERIAGDLCGATGCPEDWDSFGNGLLEEKLTGDPSGSVFEDEWYQELNPYGPYSSSDMSSLPATSLSTTAVPVIVGNMALTADIGASGCRLSPECKERKRDDQMLEDSYLSIKLSGDIGGSACALSPECQERERRRREQLLELTGDLCGAAGCPEDWDDYGNGLLEEEELAGDARCLFVLCKDEWGNPIDYELLLPELAGDLCGATGCPEDPDRRRLIEIPELTSIFMGTAHAEVITGDIDCLFDNKQSHCYSENGEPRLPLLSSEASPEQYATDCLWDQCYGSSGQPCQGQGCMAKGDAPPLDPRWTSGPMQEKRTQQRIATDCLWDQCYDKQGNPIPNNLIEDLELTGDIYCGAEECFDGFGGFLEGNVDYYRSPVLGRLDKGGEVLVLADCNLWNTCEGQNLLGQSPAGSSGGRPGQIDDFDNGQIEYLPEEEYALDDCRGSSGKSTEGRFHSKSGCSRFFSVTDGGQSRKLEHRLYALDDCWVWGTCDRNSTTPALLLEEVEQALDDCWVWYGNCDDGLQLLGEEVETLVGGCMFTGCPEDWEREYGSQQLKSIEDGFDYKRQMPQSFVCLDGCEAPRKQLRAIEDRTDIELSGDSCGTFTGCPIFIPDDQEHRPAPRLLERLASLIISPAYAGDISGDDFCGVDACPGEWDVFGSKQLNPASDRVDYQSRMLPALVCLDGCGAPREQIKSIEDGNPALAGGCMFTGCPEDWEREYGDNLLEDIASLFVTPAHAGDIFCGETGCPEYQDYRYQPGFLPELTALFVTPAYAGDISSDGFCSVDACPEEWDIFLLEEASLFVTPAHAGDLCGGEQCPEDWDMYGRGILEDIKTEITSLVISPAHAGDDWWCRSEYDWIRGESC
ncbi:MAG: hypothetical protein V6Z81_07585 [Parvularculales bacterium]